ncbi:dihydropteroate synthase [Psychrosphaera sp.]|nr:dihydropteroate synthase [Psychrosphaera sp.]
MGILNVTPDSFSDGGEFNSLNRAVKQAERMLKDGAHIIDIGGESTRPGAPKIDVQTELSRVIPVIKKLKSEFNCVISLDTSKADVMAEGLAHGIDIINDVCALSQPGALEVAAQADVPVCLMHMQGSPQTMQNKPEYKNVTGEIKHFFDKKITECERAGVSKERLWLDPGFGFGKTLNDNYKLLGDLDQFVTYKMPILAGLSRKSMIGNLLNVETNDRMLGSVIAATLALSNGANILRVHDVAETQQAVTIYNAMNKGIINE